MSPLLQTALLSALFAGLVAAGVTVAIERWGGVIGGFLGTLPSTIVPASLGIWAAHPDPDALAAAMGAVPAGMLLNVLYLLLWRALPPRLPPGPSGRRLAMVTVLTLGCWGLAATALTVGLGAARSAGLPPLWTGAVLTLGIVAVGVAANWSPRPAPRGAQRVGRGTLLLRGLLAAAAIGVSVLLARVGGGLLSGMASVFPAIYTTTMVSLWLAQGEAVQGGAIGPMMLGSASVAAYAVGAGALIPWLGPARGAPLAWILAVSLTSAPGLGWVRWRARHG